MRWWTVEVEEAAARRRLVSRAGAMGGEEDGEEGPAAVGGFGTRFFGVVVGPGLEGEVDSLMVCWKWRAVEEAWSERRWVAENGLSR